MTADHYGPAEIGAQIAARAIAYRNQFAAAFVNGATVEGMAEIMAAPALNSVDTPRSEADSFIAAADGKAGEVELRANRDMWRNAYKDVHGKRLGLLQRVAELRRETDSLTAANATMQDMFDAAIIQRNQLADDFRRLDAENTQLRGRLEELECVRRERDRSAGRTGW